MNRAFVRVEYEDPSCRDFQICIALDQAVGLADLLAFLDADPAHRVSGYVAGWLAAREAMAGNERGGR